MVLQKILKKLNITNYIFKRINDIDAGYTKIELNDGTVRNLTKEEKDGLVKIPNDARLLKYENLFKSGPGSKYVIQLNGKTFNSVNRWWGQSKEDILKLYKLGRIN